MPKFIVKSGVIGRREGSDHALHTYKIGDEIELTPSQARDFGSMVAPANQDAAVALARATTPATATESVEKPSEQKVETPPDEKPSVAKRAKADQKGA
jgi:hypothetical protein